MNYYSFLAFLVIGLLFIYTGIDWLGLLFLALAVVVLLYNPAKNTLNTTWKEVSKAEGSNPSAKFMEYAEGATKLTANLITDGKPGVKSSEWLHKSPNMAKNFFSELDKIFK